MIETRKTLWYRGLYRALSEFAFNRITVTGALTQTDGPTLFVCLHRNGAIDGAVYQRVAPRAKMTLSSQLRRNAWMRAVFDGIEIVRPQDAAKDAVRVNNADAFSAASRHLIDGGDLVFFPEGTSTLGPRHLGFKAGVARLIQQTLEQRSSLTVVPLAAHYEDATTWQSDVDIRVGAAIQMEGTLSTAHIMAVLTSALENVGLDCDTVEQRRSVEALAYATRLCNKDIPYSKALAALADHPFSTRLQDLGRAPGPFRHQGVPLMPDRRAWRDYAALTVLLPLQLAMGVLNAVPYLVMEALVGKLADGPNVRSLWRALTGLPLFTLWGAVVVSPVLAVLDWRFIPVYWIACMLHIKTRHRTKKCLITLANHLVGCVSARVDGRRALSDLHREVTHYVRSKL